MLPESQIVAGAVYQGGRQVNPGRWSGQVVPRWRPPQGLFAKGSAQQIARAALHGHHGDAGSAIRALQFYLNRAGRNLSAARRRAVEGAKRALQRANPHVDAEACHEQAEVAREWAELCASRGYLMNPGAVLDDWSLNHMRQWIRTQTYDEDEAAALEGLMLAELAQAEEGEEREYLLNLGWPEVARRAGRGWQRSNPALALVGNPSTDERERRARRSGDLAGATREAMRRGEPIVYSRQGHPYRVRYTRDVWGNGGWVVHVDGRDSTEWLVRTLTGEDRFAVGEPATVRGVALWGQKDSLSAETVQQLVAWAPRETPALALVGNGPAPIAKQRRSLPKGPKVPNAGGGNRLLKKGRKGFKLFHGREPGVYWVFTPPNKWRKATKAEVANWQGEVAIGLGAVPETHYMVPQAWKSSKGPHYYVHEHPEGKEPLEVKLASNGLTMKLPTSPDMKIEDWWYE